MKQPDPSKYNQNVDLEKLPAKEHDAHGGYDVKAPQNMDAKLEVHGKNPPKDRNLPNLKK